MALAALLVFGIRFWPAIFVGAFLVNITTAGSMGTSLGIATGNTLACSRGSLPNRLAVLDQPEQRILRDVDAQWRERVVVDRADLSGRGAQQGTITGRRQCVYIPGLISSSIARSVKVTAGIRCQASRNASAFFTKAS
jgi:hypothetical protein